MCAIKSPSASYAAVSEPALNRCCYCCCRCCYTPWHTVVQVCLDARCWNALYCTRPVWKAVQPCKGEIKTSQQTGGQEDGDCRGWTASPNCTGVLPRKVDTYSCLRPAHSWSAQLTLQHGGCLVCAPQVLSGAPLSSSYGLLLDAKANLQTYNCQRCLPQHVQAELGPSPEFLPSARKRPACPLIL
jgi:hypothetical protein